MFCSTTIPTVGRSTLDRAVDYGLRGINVAINFLYANLSSLPGFRMPIYASPKVRDHARILAQRFNRAYTYLPGLLNIFLDIRLTLLSEQDWPHYAQVLRYGVTIYDQPSPNSGQWRRTHSL
jgi:hypothetical protein